MVINLKTLKKKLKKIKSLELKREFLKKIISEFRDKKDKDFIIRAIKEIEKEQMAVKFANKKSNNEPSDFLSNLVPRSTTTKEVEDAPKYQPRENPLEQRRENLSRLERLTEGLSRDFTDPSNRNDYTPRTVENRRPQDTGLYQDRLFRTYVENKSVREIKVHDYSNPFVRAGTDVLLNPDITNEEEMKWTRNLVHSHKMIERIDPNYSTDPIENLKRRKKELEKNYK